MTSIRFGTERPVSWATSAALDFLSRNRHRRVRLEEVARHVGFSPWELDRRFKQEMGKGIGEWNEEDFWNHIGFRLWFFGESPKEAMCSVCCRDFAKFCHGFKRRFGVCPRVYQAHCQATYPPDFLEVGLAWYEAEEAMLDEGEEKVSSVGEESERVYRLKYHRLVSLTEEFHRLTEVLADRFQALLDERVNGGLPQENTTKFS
jgi:AraC-like DNA-binding protein